MGKNGQYKSNPVRAQYILMGTVIVRAGIRTIAGVTSILRENDGGGVVVLDPASERWLTGGAVTKAVSAYQQDCGMNSRISEVTDINFIEVKHILPFLAQSWRSQVRTTADMIVHMLGDGETEEARAFADAEVAALNTTYGVSKATKAA